MDLFSRKTQGGTIYIPPLCKVKVVDDSMQFRYKLPTGGKLALCVAPQYGKADKEGHFHKGLVEVYTVHLGWLEIIFQDASGGEIEHTVVEPYGTSCSFVASTGMRHAIIQGPETVFVVQTIANHKPVPNPEKNGNDWYPAEEKFNELVREHFRVRGYDM